MAEKAANSVSAYGGLGAHGLDFGEEGTKGACKLKKEIEASFSGSAMKYAPKIKDSDADDSEDSDLRDEVNVDDVDFDDKAPYSIPKDDNGYNEVLKERFGHEEFRDG